MTRRLFIGLELPASAQATLAALDPQMSGLRWLPPEQMHLTLSFIGDTEPDAFARLGKELPAVRVPPFFLPLRGLGMFKVRGQPSVIWAGTGKAHPHLFALHHHVQDAVLRAGLEPDLKPFHPHVTVARGKGISAAAVHPFLRREAETEFALVKVAGFSLFSSVLSSAGAVHRIEMSVAFA